MFFGGWVCIYKEGGKMGIGCSAKVLLPENIRNRIKSGDELADIVKGMVGNETFRQSNGTNGILTNNLYTRVKEFEDATSCALANFVTNYY